MEDLGAPILRSVVHEEYFVRDFEAGENGMEPLVELLQIVFFVVEGNDDREVQPAVITAATGATKLRCVPSPRAVTIGHDWEPEGECEVLINLDSDVPLFFSRFERVAEILDQDPQTRQKGRERYRFYRDRGYDLNTHEIDAP